MKKIKLLFISLVTLSVFIGTTTMGMAADGEQPEGNPFQAIWESINNLQNQTTGLAARVLALEDWQAEIESWKNSVESRLADLDKKITDEVARLDGRIDGAIARITDLEDWKSGIESWKASVESRLTALESQITDLQSEVRALWDKAHAVQDEITSLWLALEPNSLLEKIKTVDGSASGLDADKVDGYEANEFLSVPWSRLTSFPADCDTGQYVYGVGGTLKCSAPTAGIGGNGTDNYIPRWLETDSLENSVIYQSDAGNIGIGTASPGAKLDVVGGMIQGNSGLTISAGMVSLPNDTINPAEIAQGNAGQILMSNATPDTTWVTMSGDATISGTGALTLANTGVTAGTYRSVTVDSKGRVTAGTNPTTLAGYGITDAIQLQSSTPGIQQTGNFNISGNGRFGGNVIVASGANYIWFNPGYTDDHLTFDPPTAHFTIRHQGGPSDYILFKSQYSVNTLVVKNDGNVGIGTTNPGAKLEVAGQVKITGGSPGNGKVLTSDANGLASWQTPTGGGLPSGTSGQTLRHDGTSWVANSVLFNNGTNVGIGTVSPGKPLHVQSPSGQDGVIRVESVGKNPVDLFSRASDNAGGLWHYGGPMVFGTANVERLRITSDGNVGIGTTNPGVKLDTPGPVRIGNPSWNPSSVVGLLLVANDNTAESLPLGIKNPSGANILYVRGNGNIGIGTWNPQYLLDVEGDVQAKHFYVGDFIFQKENEDLWRMFEEEDGLYLENLKTGQVYKFLLEEVGQ